MGESRKEEEVGLGLEGAVCHCESAQGGSHHLAIDGRPSPVVKQAPVGLPEHWGHCVPPSQETYHPKCCYPHHCPPTASPILLPLSVHLHPFLRYKSDVNLEAVMKLKLEGDGHMRRQLAVLKQQVGLMRMEGKSLQQAEEAEGGAEGKTDLKDWCKGGVPRGFRNMEG